MKQIIWNAIITTIITLSGVVLNWYLLKYKIEPVPIPSSQQIKETMRRTGKRLIKGVLHSLAFLAAFVGPLIGLFLEFRSDAPVNRLSLIIVAYYVFIFTSAVCITFTGFFVTYIYGRAVRLMMSHLELTGRIIGNLGSMRDTLNISTENDESATQD